LDKIEKKKAEKLTEKEKEIKTQLQLFKDITYVATQKMADVLGLPLGTKSADYEINKANITQSLASAGAAGASAAVSAQRLAWDMNPNNPDNILKNKQINKIDTDGLTQKDVLDTAKDMDKADAREFIINSGLSDAEIVRTLNMLNIPQE
jgi:hypothetical protein